MKNKIIKKVKDLLSPLALPAVIYAENLIGKGFGETKKQIAIDFILGKLPLFLIPFKTVIRKVFSELFDCMIEASVKSCTQFKKICLTMSFISITPCLIS